jgi:hypothetical protein
MAWSRHDEDPPSIDDEADSTADTDINSLFNSSDDDETDIISGANIDSPLEINEDSDDNALLFNNKV